MLPQIVVQDEKEEEKVPSKTGCQLKRETKTIAKAQKKSCAGEDVLTKLILGKHRRGRRQPDFKTYQNDCGTQIETLRAKIAIAENNGEVKEAKRLKNMVSAYESRLVKRAKQEDTQAQIDIKTQQLQTILKILYEEVPSAKRQRIVDRIQTETPKLTVGQSISEKLQSQVS